MFAAERKTKSPMNLQKYLPPQCETLELRTEGVIAQSFVDPFGDTEKW